MVTICVCKLILMILHHVWEMGGKLIPVCTWVTVVVISIRDQFGFEVANGYEYQVEGNCCATHDRLCDGSCPDDCMDQFEASGSDYTACNPGYPAYRDECNTCIHGFHWYN